APFRSVIGVFRNSGLGVVWPSKAPGTAVFHQVYPYVEAAIVILALFLIGVLLGGASEARRLRQLAQTAIFEADHDNL
ncbi:hypothetical protein ACC722_39440, partial [Rhizobium ruizarguesonis]